MKSYIRITLFFLLALFMASGPAPGGTALAADTYTVDSVHSFIVFRIKHLGVGYAYGRINSPTGSYQFDPASPQSAMFDIQVDAAAVDTHNEKRDKHIRSSDFFDVAKHPRISFKSTAVRKLQDGVYEITGNLTFRSVTKPITVTANHTGSAKDPWGKYRSGFETQFTIKRSEFGMDFMMGGLSDEVNLTVSVEGIRD